MFYELINETTIKRAPKPLKVNGKDVFTNSEEIYNKLGYYKLKYTEMPQDEKMYEARYTLQDNVIVQSWCETTEIEG